MNIRALACAFTMMLVLVAAACQPAAEPPAETEAEAPAGEETAAAAALEAVRQAEERWEAAFNDNDAGTLAALYAEDASEMPPGERAIEGREAIQNWYAGLFGGHKAEISVEPIETRAAADWAFHLCAFWLTLTPPEGGGETLSGQHVFVLERAEDGEWLISHGVWRAEEPAAGASSD